MVIGTIGLSGSGKDTLANYLVQSYGFSHSSLSSTLREVVLREFKKSNLSREENSYYADTLRDRLGSSFLIDSALEKGFQNHIISGIYAKDEVIKLKKSGGILIAVSTDDKVRFERIRTRGDIRDLKIRNFDHFKRQSQMELDPTAFESRACLSDADLTITNNSSELEFYEAIDRVISKLAAKIATETSLHPSRESP